MRSLAVLLALVLGGCALATPLMEPTRRWEQPFDVASNVRGFVVFMEYTRPEIGVRQYERSYRYERYEPITGAWYPAELGHDGGYAFTDAAAAEIARLRGDTAISAGGA